MPPLGARPARDVDHHDFFLYDPMWDRRLSLLIRISNTLQYLPKAYPTICIKFINYLLLRVPIIPAAGMKTTYQIPKKKEIPAGLY